MRFMKRSMHARISEELNDAAEDAREIADAAGRAYANPEALFTWTTTVLDRDGKRRDGASGVSSDKEDAIGAMADELRRAGPLAAGEVRKVRLNTLIRSHEYQPLDVVAIAVLDPETGAVVFEP